MHNIDKSKLIECQIFIYIEWDMLVGWGYFGTKSFLLSQ